MTPPVRVVIPTVYRFDCPTVRSRLYPLCRELVQHGYTFNFLVIGEGTLEISPGIMCSSYSSFSELVLRIISISNQNTDIILPCKPYSITGLLSLLIARIRGIGYLLDVDDRTFPSEINKWWRLPLYLQEWCSERLLIWLKPSTMVASRALAEYWGKHVTYIPNSVDLDRFDRTRWDVTFIRRIYGITSPVIVWPAVFFQETDRKYAIQIIAEMKKTASDACLMILGDGEYLPEIKLRVSEMGLGDRVFFAGAVSYEEVPNFYASATAGFLPLRNNHYDACKGPIKLYEYMAMELPVIATDIGEPREVIQKADCGVLVPFDDPAQAAAKITGLMGNNEKLKRLGANGRNYLTLHHNHGLLAGMMAKVLKEQSTIRRTGLH